MKYVYRALPVIVIIVVGLIATGYALRQRDHEQPLDTRPPRSSTTASLTPEPAATAVSTLATNLDIPWSLAWLPDQRLLLTERPGRVRLLTRDSATPSTILEHPDVAHVGEGGLLGITLHPQFKTNKFVYLYLTTESGGSLHNRVERYELDGTTLEHRTIIIDNIPARQFHNGGALAFGPDQLLYVTTGDASNESSAQDTQSIAGKILRLNDDGSIPTDNPFGNAVYSYGHRNPQGLIWDSAGRLWATEHGRSGLRSGFDEINLIEKGQNYGWPVIQGDETRTGMRSPAAHSGASTTWAPAGIVFHAGNLFVAGLRGESLYRATLDGTRVTSVTPLLHQQFGRLRAVSLGPDSSLYVTTSNTDGRGTTQPADDQIIKLDLTQLLP